MAGLDDVEYEDFIQPFSNILLTLIGDVCMLVAWFLSLGETITMYKGAISILSSHGYSTMTCPNCFDTGII